MAVLMSCVSSPDRVWNPWTATMVKTEFRKRIEKASKGELKPVEEVKPVDTLNPPPLYEIRWQGISVTDRSPDGTQRFGTALVRMYHSEPSEAPNHFIGHHAHEKLIDVDDINATQDDEMRIAINWHDQGRDAMWGISGIAV